MSHPPPYELCTTATSSLYNKAMPSAPRDIESYTDTTEQDLIGSYRTNMVLEQKDSTVVVIGETGCGKSTWINMMTNFFKNGSLENLRIAIPTKDYYSTERYEHSETNVRDGSVAQTTQAFTYTFKKKNIKFSIIDTPGLNDTKGLDQDDINLNKILNAAVDAENLSAIIMIINGTNARVTHNIQNLIAKFRGSLPDSIMSNIIVICTMCREETCNFKNFRSLGFVPYKIFYMNNTIFSSPITEKSNLKLLYYEFSDSLDICRQITETVQNMSVISTIDFQQIRDLRNSIKSELHRVKNDILQLQNVHDIITVAQDTIKHREDYAAQFKNYTKTKVIKTTRIVNNPTINKKNTICDNCNKTCHEDCKLGEIIGKNSAAITHCYAFQCTAGNGDQNTCKICNCSYMYHYHSNNTIVEDTETLEEVIEEMKKQYLEALASTQEEAKKLSEHELTRKSVEHQIDTLCDKLSRTCHELKKICSGFNFVNELNIMIYQLKRDASLLHSVEARRTADKFISTLEHICDSLSRTAHVQYVSDSTDDIQTIDVDDVVVKPYKKKSLFARFCNMFRKHKKTSYNILEKPKSSSKATNKQPKVVVNIV